MNCYKPKLLTISPKMLEYIRETTNKSLKKYYNNYNYNMDSLLVINPITNPNPNGNGNGRCMWIFFMGVFVGYQCSDFFKSI